MNGGIEGIRLWLSGAISEEASEDEAQRIRRFVAALAQEVFRRGGRLLHGSHPSLLQTLLQSATDYFEKTGDRAGLVLVVSRYYSKDPQRYGVDLEYWNKLTVEPAIVTREEVGRDEQAVRSGSLEILRNTLLEQCNAIVAIGGKWWVAARGKAGVPKEIELAAGGQLPLFLLGGLGGATREYLEQNRNILRRCRNGLSEEQNLELAGLKDPEALAELVVSQIARLPVRERDPDAGRPFRILCLDGGGLRGVYTASVLAYWEKAEGRRIVDHFDLIAGTSTGGLLAIGLGLGLSPAQMLTFYLKEGAAIFPTENAMDRLWHAFRHWFTSKFDQAVLRAKLEQIYDRAPQGRQSLNRALCRLVITSYNTKADQLVVFRTPHGPFDRTHADQDPVLAAMATSAAPTYFDPLATAGVVVPIEAVDGGVWANNPGSVALAEAVGPLGVSVGRIDMLSIGTTYSPAIVGQPFLLNDAMARNVVGLGGGRKARLVSKLFWPDARVRGKVGWVANIAEFLMKTQAQTASRVCSDFLGRRFLRIDDATTGAALDDAKSMEQLVGLGEAAAERHRREVAIRFLNGVPVDRWR